MYLLSQYRGLKRDEKMVEKLLWITVEGLDKVEILEGLGFKVLDSGILTLNGKNVLSSDGTGPVKAEEVKAIIPGSLSVVTDISELEPIME